MEEINFNETPAEEVVESEKALKCDSNEPKKAKTPAMFKAGIALMCATSALSLGAIGACGFLGYKLYKNQKNQNAEPENSMGTVVANKGVSISVSKDGYWVLNGEKTNIKAEAVDGQDGLDGEDGLSVLSASIVDLDKWGITTQIMFKMSDNSYRFTAPRTQIISEHFYEAEDMSDILQLKDYGIKKIKLKNDINLSSSIQFDGETVIDLNRNTLNYTAANPLKVAEESSLTIKNGSLYLLTNTGVAVEGEDAELSFNKVKVFATAVVAETLEDNASIKLENTTVETIQQGRRYGAGSASSVGSLFIVKGEHSNIVVSGSNFTTNRAIFAASDNAAEIKLVVKDSKINTSAAMLDIDTDVVVPTLDLDQASISTIETLNTSPITSGSFNFDPTQAGAELEGVEQFNVNGQNVLATDFANLVEIVEEGSTINLTKDLVLSSNIVVDKKLTINIGSHFIRAPHNTDIAVFKVENNGKLTINATEEGGINAASDSNNYSIAVWARNGGQITINGGVYTNYGAKSTNGSSANNNELIYTSGDGSSIIINDGYFIGNIMNERWGTRYTLNKHDSTDSSIIVNGGLFFGYNPAESLSENPVENFVGENRLTVAFNGMNFFHFDGTIYGVTHASNFENIVNNGFTLFEYEEDDGQICAATVEVDSIILNGNVTLTKGFVIDREFTLDLNTYSISAPTSTSTALIRVNSNGRLTIEGNGTINSASSANDYSIAVWASNGGQVTINGGTFTNVGAKDFEDNGVTPNNNELLYVSGSGSLITINNAIVIGNSENETWGTRYTLNKADGCNSNIVVNGGTFVSYNPAESLSENPIDNFVSAGHLIVKTGNNYAVVEGTLADAIANAVAGSTIILTEDIVLNTGVIVNKELTLNLGDFTITAPHNAEIAVLKVEDNGKLTINANEEGMINAASDSNNYSIAVWARNGGQVTINGGFYTNVGAKSVNGSTPNNNELIYTSGEGSIITINDGWFMGNVLNEKWGTRYTLNKHDSTNSTIIVNGGYFYDYNPAESLSENPVANFVAEGNIVVSDGETYMVVSADMFDELVILDEINYISLHSNVVLNKGFIIDRELTLNLNSYSISAPTSTSTALIRVNANGRLTIEGNGTINSASSANDYSIAVWASNGGQVTINGGTYTNVGAKDFEDNGVTPNNNELLYVSGSGSLITINNAIIIGNSENETWGTRYTLNKADGCNSNIVVNGGTFVSYNPAESLSENPIDNFVAEGYFVYKVGNNYTIAAIADLVEVINNNAGASIMLPTALVVDSKLTINLNGCTISTPNDTIGDGVFHVVAGGDLTINGEGTINGVGAGTYHMAIWVEGGKATINGGTFTNVGATNPENPNDTQFDLMYVKGGELVINGGTFIAETPKWTLNLRDTIPGTISVKGGTYLGYNPTESHTENPVANFIADGFKAVADGNNFVIIAE